MFQAPCFNHPATDAVAACPQCGRPFCDACLVEFLGQRYCGECRDSRLQLMQTSPVSGHVTGDDAIYAGSGTVDMGRWLTNGWSLISTDLVTFAVATLLASLVALGTCGIAAGAMNAGLFMLVFRKMTYGQVEIGNVFDGFRRMLNAFLATLLLAVGGYLLALIAQAPSFILMAVVGSSGDSTATSAMSLAAQGWNLLAQTATGAFLAGATFFVLPHIAVRNANIGEALQVSWAVFRRNPWMFMLTAFLFQLIAQLGVIALCVGIFVTVPLIIAAQAQAYADHFGIQGWDQQ